MSDHLKDSLARAQKIVSSSPEFQKAFYARYLPVSLLETLAVADLEKNKVPKKGRHYKRRAA